MEITNELNTEEKAIGESIMEKENVPSFTIPVWRRYTLSIAEAAVYYHIGVRKLRSIVEEHPNEEFVIMNGNRVLIKKNKFEEFLDNATAI